jgi:hypothetical protein
MRATVRRVGAVEADQNDLARTPPMGEVDRLVPAVAALVNDAAAAQAWSAPRLDVVQLVLDGGTSVLRPSLALELARLRAFDVPPGAVAGVEDVCVGEKLPGVVDDDDAPSSLGSRGRDEVTVAARE